MSKGSFDLDLRTFPQITRIDSDKGRKYETPSGNRYPSVTTVLGSLNSEYVDAWREAVGAEYADNMTARSAARGTYLHDNLEKYILGEEYLQEAAPANVEQFNLVAEWLRKHVQTVYGIESQMWSDRLKIAGTADLIALVAGRKIIVDFKTSYNDKSEDQIGSYRLQCTAYSEMWRELTGERIDHYAILMAPDHLSKLLVFFGNTTDHIAQLEQVIGDFHANSN